MIACRPGALYPQIGLGLGFFAVLLEHLQTGFIHLLDVILP